MARRAVQVRTSLRTVTALRAAGRCCGAGAGTRDPCHWQCLRLGAGGGDDSAAEAAAARGGTGRGRRRP